MLLLPAWEGPAEGFFFFFLEGSGALDLDSSVEDAGFLAGEGLEEESPEVAGFLGRGLDSSPDPGDFLLVRGLSLLASSPDFELFFDSS